jgi:hypothetical protein
VQKLKWLMKPSPRWGAAHSVPKFDLEAMDGNGKTVTNPGFGNSQNPFETRI